MHAPPRATMHAPPEQPRMPPGATMHAPRATMHAPPGATTHTPPPEQPCMPPIPLEPPSISSGSADSFGTN